MGEGEGRPVEGQLEAGEFARLSSEDNTDTCMIFGHDQVLETRRTWAGQWNAHETSLQGPSSCRVMIRVWSFKIRITFSGFPSGNIVQGIVQRYNDTEA